MQNTTWSRSQRGERQSDVTHTRAYVHGRPRRRRQTLWQIDKTKTKQKLAPHSHAHIQAAMRESGKMMWEGTQGARTSPSHPHRRTHATMEKKAKTMAACALLTALTDHSCGSFLHESASQHHATNLRSPPCVCAGGWGPGCFRSRTMRAIIVISDRGHTVIPELSSLFPPRSTRDREKVAGGKLYAGTSARGWAQGWFETSTKCETLRQDNFKRCAQLH